MGENRIGRRIKKTTCECDVVEADNSIKRITVELNGEVPIGKTQRRVARKLKNERVLVRSVSYSSFYCSMSIDDFVKYGVHKP